MKYKVGDRVRIREDLEAGQRYGKDNLIFSPGMNSSLGKTATIVNTRDWREDGQYELDIFTNYVFNDDMLEDIVDAPKFKRGDKVKFIKNVGNAARYKYERYLGKTFIVEGVKQNPDIRYDLIGIIDLEFAEEELELYVEEIEDANDNWLGKQYEILYFRGGSYRLGIRQDDNILTVKGTLIKFESPFTGRFFLKNLNGALEIITMESVVEMREIA